MRTAVIAALPRELAGLTKGLKAKIDAGSRGVAVFETDAAVFACAGMGSKRVTLAVAAALRCTDVGRLLSVGLAGACDPKVRAGKTLHFRTVIDLGSGERFQGSGGDRVLVTADAIAGVDEKRRLFASYDAAAVDMEAACVARLAVARGVPFAAIKAISDEADAAMDGMERFATEDGGFSEARFALYTAMRPMRWMAAVRLGQGSVSALRALRQAVEADLQRPA